MGAEENKAVVRRYIEAFNAGDFAAAAAEFAPGAVVHGVLADGGVDQARQVWAQLRAAFPDHRNVVEELLAEGDTSVAVRLTDQATFTGEPFLGVAATGQRFEIVAMEWFHFTDGMISERWAARDSGAMLRQLGVTPAR
jgi:steroid delta-isomerase-like uncharacterized protein